MEWIKIGKIINTHGIKGELKIESWSDFDQDRYQKGNTIYVLHEETPAPFTVQSFRKHGGFSLVSFAEIKDINEAEKYKNDEVMIEESARKELTDGHYYRNEIEGLDAFDENGSRIGVVTAVEETKGAQNNLRIQRENQEDALVPFVPLFIKDVDLEKKKITIHVIEGLL